MKQFAHNNFMKALMVLVAILIAGASVFSMAAMSHGASATMQSVKLCASAILGMSSHETGCTDPIQSEACVDFHFDFIAQFTNAFSTGGAGLKLMMIVLFASLLLISLFLVNILKSLANLMRVRLRYLFEETISVFRDNLGFWLTLFEKRDPAYAFIIA